jgi:magnesium chelatase family protein
MAIDVPEVPTLDMLGSSGGEKSAEVAKRVTAARALQKERFASLKMRERTNCELQGEALHNFVIPDDKGKKLLEQATEVMRLSMRGYTRVLRVSRTIADLEQSETVSHIHVGEALSYRQMQLGKQSEFA